MIARAFIITGFIFSILGILGSILMLLTGAPGSNIGILLFWIGVLGLCVYFESKH